eukprot:186176-Pyramimonas_sp.AAC.1
MEFTVRGGEFDAVGSRNRRRPATTECPSTRHLHPNPPPGNPAGSSQITAGLSAVGCTTQYQRQPGRADLHPTSYCLPEVDQITRQ